MHADGTLPLEDTPPRLGMLGDFELVRELGRGGMGVVYEAVQTSLGRRVAVKLLPRHLLDNDESRKRFEQEARAAAGLHHTNIVPVFAFGAADGQPYYAMQLIEGVGLDAAIAGLARSKSLAPTEAVGKARGRGQPAAATAPFQASRLPVGAPIGEPPEALPATPCRAGSEAAAATFGHDRVRQAARIGLQAAEALDYAHRHGVVHRDVKPANLLWDDRGIAWVADFGLAKLAGGENLTESASIVGTLRYLPPEALHGRRDALGDVYALGLTLFELLALRPLRKAQSRAALLGEIAAGEAPDLRKLDPALPRDLATIVAKACEREPERRYASAAALAEDLRRFLEDRPIAARPIGRLGHALRWCRRNRALAAALLAAAALTLVVAGGGAYGSWALGKALRQSEANLFASDQANTQARQRLWHEALARSKALRTSGRQGQRFEALRAIGQALELPTPPGASRDALRNEALAALCLPDVETELAWNGWPEGTASVGFDRELKRYARGDVSIRRVADDGEQMKFRAGGPVHEYWGLRFSPDGRFLAVSAREVQMWRIDGARPELLFKAPATMAAFEPSGPRVALNGADGIDIRELPSGRSVRKVSLGNGPPPHVDWHPRLPRLVVNRSDGYSIVDADTGAVRRGPPLPHPPGRCGWTPAGDALDVAPAGRGLPILRIDADTGAVRQSFRGHRDAGIVCASSPNGEQLASNDWSGLLRWWDARSGHQLLTLPSRGKALKFDPTGERFAAALDEPRVAILRCAGAAACRTLSAPNASGFLVFGSGAPRDASGLRIAAGSGHGAQVVNLATGNVEGSVSAVRALRFDADGSLVTYGSAGIERWPAKPGENGKLGFGAPQRLGPGQSMDAWGCSADGKTVAVPNYQRGAILWRGGDDFKPLRGAKGADVRCCAVSPDGKWIAGAQHDGSGVVELWSGAAGEQIRTLPAGNFCNAAFSPDGHWLATTGDSRARLWEVGSWRELPLATTRGVSSGIAFSVDGTLLATGNDRGQLLLFDPRDGHEVARRAAPTGTRLQAAAFSADGRYRAAVGVDSGTLQLFDLELLRDGLRELGLDWE